MNKKISLMRPFIGEEEEQAVQEVLDSGYLTEGPKTQEFERAFAIYVGAKELCLRVLGVGAGDEVIVPDITYPITGGVVSIVGASCRRDSGATG